MPDAIIDDRSGIARILPIAPAAYLALVKVLRVSGAQTLSKLGVYDGVGTIALGLTLASIIVPRMSGLTGGLTALGVLVALQYLVKATLLLEPLLLHRDGEPSRHPMRNQRVTLDELFAAVFLAGGGSHDRAAAVFLKSDGFLTANAPRAMMDGLHAFIGTEGQDINWWQMSLRACLVFVIGVLIVRFAATRAFGKWAALDIILAVVVGSNLGRAMTGNAPFVPTLVATCVLLALHDLLIRASARWSWLSLITKGRSVQLVEDGQPLKMAMRRSGIGERDLHLALRSAGHSGLEDVQSVMLERNGDITVVPRT